MPEGSRMSRRVGPGDFPRWSLALALAATLMTLGGMGWAAWAIHGASHDARTRDVQLLHLGQQIRFADQALTTSARLLATTGEFRWEKRYSTYEARLDWLLELARQKVSAVAEGDALARIARANEQLVALERRAIALAYRGRNRAAYALLTQPRYRQAKARYQNGLQALRQRVREAEVQTRQGRERHLFYLSGVGFGGMLLLALVWAWSVRRLYRWQVQRGQLQEQLLKSLGEGVFGIDAAGRFLFLNPAAVAALGFSSEDAALGRASHDQIHHTNADGDRHSLAECPIYQVLVTGRELASWQDRFWRADGSDFPVELHAAPLLRSNGRVWGAVVAFRDITDRKEAERAVEEKRQELEEAQRMGALGNWAWDMPSGDYTWSRETFRIFGLTPGEVTPSFDTFLRYVYPDDRPAVTAAFNAALAGGPAYDMDHRILTASGEERVVREFAEVQWGEDGEPVRMAGTMQDITEYRRLETELRVERDFVAAVMDNLPEVFYVFDSEGHFLRWNEHLQEVTGYGADEIAGMHALDFIPEDEHAKVWESIESAFRREGMSQVEGHVRTREGIEIPYLFMGKGIVLGGQLVKIGFGIDQREHKRMEAELQYRADHDPLTGVLNRRRFEVLLQREVTRALRYGQALTVAMFDLDHFKWVNDTYGHDIGDEVLRKVTGVVEQRLRDADMLARWGGEEFMLLLPETGIAGARQLAEDLRQRVAGAWFAGPGHVTMSLGLTEYRSPEGLKELTKRVDDALYEAKAAGRNRVTEQ